jgi:ABC-type transport system involved in cytochrome c biogenesis permease subunit
MKVKLLGLDPKETWALIIIMVYAFVIHARCSIFKRKMDFNLMSMFAFFIHFVCLHCR